MRGEPLIIALLVAPSMFGRNLIEQVRADAKNEPGRMVPVIVDKCIRAVEASGKYSLVLLRNYSTNQLYSNGL